MIVPFLLLFASLAGVAATLMLPGWSDLILLAGPSTAASLIILVRAYRRRGTGARRTLKNWVVVDGSNVMHWKDGTAQVSTVSEILHHLKVRGFSAGVVFDANAGYKMHDRYQNHSVLARILKLPEDWVLVVPKGTPADPVILAAARDLGARIVSNDRFRGWEETHPEVRAQGHIIRGGYRDGNLWLDVD